MAPISPDNTQRFFVDYTVAGYQHTLLCRANSTVTAADAGATIAAFLAAIESSFYEITIDGFRSAASGTNITVPEVWPGAATYGSGAGDPKDTAHYMDFVGRGPTGHRVRVAVFGAIISDFGGDYRLSGSESALVGNAIAELTSDVDIFNDVDYGVPVWKNYANLGVNAYWRNKIR
jgi:hypothetical protein